MRRCACPCKAPLDGMRPDARYVSPAHKTRHYRERAEKRAQRATVTSQRRSGRQLTERKAEQAVIDGIREYVNQRFIAREVLDSPERIAHEVVQRHLPERQREGA